MSESSAEKSWGAVSQIFRNLPLERCTVETILVTDEEGWLAPEGYAFRLGGQFEVDSYQSAIEYRDKPESSRELFIAENADLYQHFLDQTNDPEQAFKLLMEDLEDYEGEFEPPEEFIGKWLVISPKPAIEVKKEVYAWYEQGFFGVINNIRADKTKRPLPVMFDATEGFAAWSQLYARAILGSSSIILVEHQEPAPEVFKPDPVPNEIALPYAATLGVESEDYFESTFRGHYPQEAKQAIVRQQREYGRPFRDDPAKDLVVLRGERAKKFLDSLLDEKKLELAGVSKILRL